eukprot:TRINITY_DN1057_c1_g1_i4.p1 TRINITY_DN1057_c1_g1~~TRINITY_DN1057_c1_g1_i4.p1  ORF type:complete len:384 (+),score=177.24 TRINITY_DN1057_c1_g1_i4:125-1276(+)
MMKKYFVAARQAAKEKIIKTETTVNSEETNAQRENFNTIKLGFTKLQANTKNLCSEGLPLAIAQNEIVAEYLIGFGNTLRDTNLSDVASSLVYVGENWKHADKYSQAFLDSMKDEFVEKLSVACEGELKEITDLRIKQEVARLHLESSLGELKTLQKKVDPAPAKLKSAEDSAALSQEDYDKETNNFLQRMTQLENSCRTDFMASLTSLAQSQLKALEESAAIWREIVTYLDTVGAQAKTPIISPPSFKSDDEKDIDHLNLPPSSSSSSSSSSSLSSSSSSVPPVLPDKQLKSKIIQNTVPQDSPDLFLLKNVMSSSSIDDNNIDNGGSLPTSPSPTSSSSSLHHHPVAPPSSRPPTTTTDNASGNISAASSAEDEEYEELAL